MVDGHDYTSNTRKVLKHLDKLKAFQEGKPISPIMVHLSLTAACNLNCSYCCYENRNKKEVLSLEQAKTVIDQFTLLGTKGFELTGSGEPTLYPYINEIIEYAKSKGASLGLITNGTATQRVKDWSQLDWVRISPHVLNLNNQVLEDKFYKNVEDLKTKTKVSSVYIWSDENVGFQKFLDFIEKYELPARVTPDLTKSPEWIQENMAHVKELIKDNKYAFVSEFNTKLERPIKYCNTHLIKPFIHTDGYVYECPGSSFNGRDVEEKFRICSIDNIAMYYTSKESIAYKERDCSFCKYQHINELLYDIKTEVTDIDFA